MHTSAPDGRLFPDPLMQWTGVLLHKAEARSKQLDPEGHVVPVLCLDIELDNALRNHMHVEQPFPAGQHQQCEAAAHRLHKGMRVTVQAPSLDLRLVAANTQHIHVVHNPEKESASA